MPLYRLTALFAELEYVVFPNGSVAVFYVTEAFWTPNRYSLIPNPYVGTSLRSYNILRLFPCRRRRRKRL